MLRDHPRTILQRPLEVYAAGSLREVLTRIAHDFQNDTGHRVALTFGASGLLRERIENGAPARVFASADMQHPLTLAAGGHWGTPVVFARNTLCALAGAHMSATPATLLSVLLQPGVRVGTSTPKSDPSGDYAWTLFRRADAVQPGAFKLLETKALQLTGAVDSPRAPAGRGLYAWAMDTGQADVFLTYRTNALAAQAEVPGLQIVAMPPELQVGATYAMTVRMATHSADATDVAAAFARVLLEPSAQALLRQSGFESP